MLSRPPKSEVSRCLDQRSAVRLKLKKTWKKLKCVRLTFGRGCLLLRHKDGVPAHQAPLLKAQAGAAQARGARRLPYFQTSSGLGGLGGASLTRPRVSTGRRPKAYRLNPRWPRKPPQEMC